VLIAEPVPVLRGRRGLSVIRGYRYCEHPAKPLGEAVCPCDGCGANCPGYTPEPAA